MNGLGRLERVRTLAGYLQANLLGQDEVLQRAADVFARGELGLIPPDRPKGAMLAVGPTGTGKTEMVLLAAEYLFGSDCVRRIDMSEFQRSDAVERLLGADSRDEGALGRLSGDIGPRVWLFDELEKAHPKVFDLFIQILEPGRITLSSGRILSFAGDYIAFTSNLGADASIRMTRSGHATIEQAVLRRVASELRPELLARIPDQLVFRRLEPEVQRGIAQLHLDREVNRLGRSGHQLTIAEGVLEFVLRQGFHPQLGARPLRQIIERNLRDAVVRALFRKGQSSGSIIVDYSGNSLILI